MSISNPALRRSTRPGQDDFPQVFGKYVLLRPMARGGMGELFLAAAGETGGFEKLCVVKKVLDDLDDPGVRRRFLDEAKVVVRLNHANLVQTFDAGRIGDTHYLAMELVEGKDLRAVWNRCAQLHRRIPVDFALFAVRELCRGLDYVHDAMGLDLVHRDISPPNILVGYHGEVKVTDFGLAKHAIKRELTSPGVVFGRYSYLSPEQARGLPADRRTDIYAAGIVLWEMLTGRQLFPAESKEGQGPALSVLRNPTIRAPSSLVPGIPEGVDDVCLKALAVAREERYSTAGQFRVALSEILAKHFPSTGVDRVSDFMREIFARERRLETQDYAGYSREDFSAVRIQADAAEAISVTESGVARAVELRDSDVVELESGALRASPSLESLEAAAGYRVGAVIERRYQLNRLLGIGGMGAVYHATHMVLGKDYALKVLHDVYSRDAELIDRFMREARAATQTGHPNIIDVVDISTTESGELYFVMELLDGADLGAAVSKQGGLNVKRAVNIAKQICRAVGAAHEVGIIHRDLKSENIILVERGGDPDFVKVLDFGICKQLDTAASSQTTPGLVMGSPDYMAPEQAAGIDASEATDIYAVGTILFEMLTGRLPFLGRNAIDVLMQKGSRDALPVRRLRPEVPDALAKVVAQCLSRHPEDRPESMRALEYELTRSVDGRASAVAAVMGLKLPGEEEEFSTGEFGEDVEQIDESDLVETLDIEEEVVTGVFAAEDIVESDASGSSAPMPSPAATREPSTPPQYERPSSEGGAVAGLDIDALEPPPPSIAPSAASSASMEREAAASATSMSAAIGSVDAPKKRGGQLMSGVKALFFVGLGVLLAGGLGIVVFDIDPFGKDAKQPPSPVVQNGANAAQQGETGESVPEEAVGETGEAGETGGLDPKDAGQGESAGDAQVDPEQAGVAVPETPEELITMAETALEAEHWRDPFPESLAFALNNLRGMDPKNEAIDRVRKQAQDILEPRAEKAVKKKQWETAVFTYRDLWAVFPDYEAGVPKFIRSLVAYARGLKRDKRYDEALVAADEIISMDAKHFVGLRIRADCLAALERWEEAVPAYRAALRVKPRNKDVRKSYWRARSQLGKEKD